MKYRFPMKHTASLRNIKLTVAYDGTAYHGFQRQANHVLTIQAVMEERLAKIFGHRLQISGSGRTDSGVHAYGQVVSFFTDGTIPVLRIPPAAKSLLPPDIVVLSAEEVDPDFDARWSAKSKLYSYKIYQGKVADPFLRNYAWHFHHPLDVPAMHAAAQIIVGTHDFSAFRGAGSADVHPIRTIMETSCYQEGAVVECTFWGTGFLYHMVRNLVGTLVSVGRGKQSKQEFSQILASLDRRQAGITAPAQGLYLQKVLY